MTELERLERARLAELYDLNILDTEAEQEFDEIVRLASLICETPMSLITLIDKDRQWFKARIGIEGSETARDIAFCDHAIREDKLMVVENAVKDSRFKNNPYVLNDPNVRFYAGMPLITSNGYHLGTLCILDSKPRALDTKQKYALEVLSKQVIKQIEFRSLNFKLKNASQRLRQATEGARVGTFELDLADRSLQCDDIVYSIYGITRQAYPNLVDFWKKALHPEDRRVLENLFQGIADGENYFDIEFRIYWEDYSLHHIKTRAEIVRDAQGKPLRIVGAVWDISEQKHIEEQLKLSNERDRIFIEQSPNAIAMFDTSMRYLAASQQWIKDYRLEGKKIIGQSHYEIFPETSEDWKQIHRDCMKGAINKCKEAYFVRDDGSSQWITWEIRPWYLFKDHVGGILMYTADITHFKEEEKEAKEAIIKAKNLAEQSAELKETFLANMSHEIRTPMNAIIGFTDLLLKKNLEGEEREYVQIVKNSGENLLRIINDILDISKINSGMMTFEEHPINIPETFTSLRAMISSRAEQKGLSLNFDNDPGLSRNVLGDPTRLTQIILNLLGNAIKFTQHGGVFVTSKILKEEDSRFLVEFKIKDTGIGIAEDKLKHIFERFSQAEKHTTRNYGGTGLGLSIAKQLIELQGGRIYIKSKPDCGSEFIFELPMKKAVEAREQDGYLLNIDPNALKDMNVLLVDDNPTNVKLVLGIFRPYHIKSDIAENGKQAVEKVRTGNYDLVLMDIEMPEMSGYEATISIRNELRSKVPIIAMSAHAMSAEREKSLHLGMNDYLSKPIKAELLLEKIGQISLKKELYEGSIKKSKLIDLKTLKESMHGRNSLVMEILDLFLDNVSEDLVALKEAISRKDFNTLRRHSHRLKSTVLTIGIEPVGRILHELEKLSVSGEQIEKIKFLFEELSILMKQAILEVELEKSLLKTEIE